MKSARRGAHETVNTWGVFWAAYQTVLRHSIGLLCGPLAVLVGGLVDASLFGFPVDPLLACYVYHHPHNAVFYVLLMSLGSAAGATVPYLIGYTSGEKAVARRIGERRLGRARELTEKFGMLALFIPAILPPPAPFKLFEFSAGVAKLAYRRFVLAVLCGRIVRFSLVALLTRRFGTRVVEAAPALLRLHWRQLLAGILVVVAASLAIKLLARNRHSRSGEKENALAPLGQPEPSPEPLL